MYPKIDWFSFTLPTDAPLNSKGIATQEYVVNEVSKVTGLYLFEAAPLLNWTLEASKGFYLARLRHDESGLAVSWGGINAHLLVELSGKTCDFFDTIGALQSLIIAQAERATRIDIAVDLLTDCTPERFSACRNTDKWKHTSYVYSTSGETFYIGSRKGERMARVYRYYEPHPRAAFLRVESEYKGDAARALSARFGDLSLPSLAAMAHHPFGWTHELWTVEELSGERLSYTAYRSNNASTVRWLYGVVAASLRRAVKDGLVDWLEFERLVTGGDSNSHQV